MGYEVSSVPSWTLGLFLHQALNTGVVPLLAPLHTDLWSAFPTGGILELASVDLKP
jgi:hypothetical protein